MKRIRKLFVLCIIALFAFTLVACADGGSGDVITKKEKTPTPTVDAPTPTAQSQNPDENTPTPQADPTPTAASENKYDKYGYIKKYTVGDDPNAGIYAIVVYFTELIPDKGTITYKYYNDESGVETAVCTFVINYEKGSNGLYEAQSFYNGELYLNYHKLEAMKTDLTFGANTRAKRCEMFLDADGKEEKIYEFFSEAANK